MRVEHEIWLNCIYCIFTNIYVRHQVTSTIVGIVIQEHLEITVSEHTHT